AQGAWGVRVHDVRASADAVRTAAAWAGAHAPGEPVSEDVLP
ncbi:dihydropteroate synthase, partial [Micrococcus luteus]|nr:dihydropteroate synthase [Micrococcus luteus]